jgi:hypothetical protein
MITQKVFPFFILLAILTQVNSAYGQEAWQQKHTRHFVISYKDAPEDFIKSVEEGAERFYDEITRDLGFNRFSAWPAESRIAIFIYRDQEDYRASAQQEAWSQGVANFHQKEIRTFPAAHGFFDTVLPHELGHIIFREFIGENRALPLWIDEGVAMFQERAKRWGAHKIVQKAIAAGQFIPLRQLSGIRLSPETDRELIELFYAESASAVYYMIMELGQQRFVNFCRRLKDNDSFPQALHSCYTRFKDVDGLNKAWISYLDRQ